MKKLNRPNVNASTLLSECMNGIGKPAIQEHYTLHRGHLDKGIADYEQASLDVSWCNLPRVPNKEKERRVVGTLTKEELTKLYSNYMVPKRAPARARYDQILVAANGKCPFCAGIGHAETLDHFLPKANFPLYSVVPENLVPCCRDCNTGKSNAFATASDSQTIHPYTDAQHFFVQKWTTATVTRTNPVSVQFAAMPPLDWADADRNRAICHFNEYDLAKRYSIEASTEIASVIYLRGSIFRDHPPAGFQEYLAECGMDPTLPINGWRRTLYTALSQTDWFYRATF
jgi:5-methylcytosine-specific restriction endonuclease McrA